MKRYLGRRLIGIVLAGMLIVENCITTQAAEFPEAETEILSEAYEETQDMQSTEYADDVPDSEAPTEEPELEEVSTVQSEEWLDIYPEEQAAIQLEAPTDLHITGRTENSVTLQWVTVKESSDYKVYRSPEENTGYEVLAEIHTDSNKGAYTDSTCGADQQYYYKVVAELKQNDGTLVQSPDSNIVRSDIYIKSITLDKAKIKLETGKQAQLSVAIEPDTVGNAVSVTWTSDNEKVATVENGLVTAISTGKAQITASAGGVQASCEVSVVTPVTDIQLSKEYIELLSEDDSEKITITTLPAEAANEDITWQINGDQIVDCELENNILTVASKGILGETTIILQSGNAVAKLAVNVVLDKDDIDSAIIPVNKVQIQAELSDDDDVNGIVNLKMGDDTASSTKLSAKISPQNATNQNIVWTSSDNSIVTVTDQGVLTAVSIGEATITALADNGVSDSIDVIVLAADRKFKMIDTSVTLYSNATGDKGNNTYQVRLDRTDIDCNYRSSDVKIAKVDSKGTVTALNPGTVTITAYDPVSGCYGTMTVIVKKMIDSVNVPADTMEVVEGSTVELFFDVLPRDVSKDVLTTLSFETEKKAPITIDKNWTKNSTSGSVKFTANKEGETNLYIRSKYLDAGGYTKTVTEKTIKVKVVAKNSKALAASIKLSGETTVKSGAKTVLVPVVKDTDGVELRPDEVSIGYTSSDESIATVAQDGTVTAIKGGKATITAYVMDGSNKKATFTINVKQRPEKISFEREAYGIAKEQGKTAKVTIKPVFSPANTDSGYKGVAWKVTDVRNAEGSSVSSDDFSNYFIINNSGVVTAQKNAVEGMQATVTCTSNAYEEKEVLGSVVVKIQPKQVSSVKFNQSNMQVVGLTEHELAFSTTYAKGFNSAQYSAYSSDDSAAEVISAENGVVKIIAHKYGTVSITLCADNMVTVTGKVTIYPFERGTIQAQSANYTLQQPKYNGADKARLQFVDAKTRKNVVASDLFTYQSSNPDIVYVDANGIAYVNPQANDKITSSNNTVTITATLKDDPDKRKATTKVTVCQTEQIERFEVSYYDKENKNWETLTNSGKTFIYVPKQKIILKITAYGANNNVISRPSVSFASSDNSVASMAYSSNQDLKRDASGVYVDVSVNKYGKFSVGISAKDQKGIKRNIAFSACAGEPILTSDGLGTINSNAESVKVGEKNRTASDKAFTILPSDGSEIIKVSARSTEIKVVKSGKTETVKTSFTVQEEGNNQYRLMIDTDKLKNAVEGTYAVTLNVTRSPILEEETDDDEFVTKTIQTSFKIVNQLPKIDNARVSINSYIKGDAAQIAINTTEKIENVAIAEGTNAEKLYELYSSNGKWYIKIKDDQFANWKKTSDLVKLQVKLKGYANTAPIIVNVSIKSVKPVVKQLTVPAVQLKHGGTVYTTLTDGKGNTWTDYTIVNKEPDKAVFKVGLQGEKTQITFPDPDMKIKGQGASYTQKVLVQKAEWRAPVELSISVKAYNGASVPVINFANPTVYINRRIGEDRAETAVKNSMNNVELQQGEWKILDTCTYKVRENKKTVVHMCSEVFETTYTDGKLEVALKENAQIPKGTYKLVMTGLWDEKNDEGMKQPLKTAQLSVVIKDVDPVVNIKLSGKIDLVKRSSSALQGTVTVNNVNESISKIQLVNTGSNQHFTDDFYCVSKDNTFKIYARSKAVLYNKAVKGGIEVTLSDGTVLPAKEISFTPTQSNPKISNIDTQIIYKSAETQTSDYNLNKCIEKGVYISKITAESVPSGMKLQDSNGHLFVTLSDKTLKAGKYQIKVNLYFKGAAPATGNQLGKQTTKTITVEVRE